MSDYLPIEVQLEIMNKLPVKSLLQFRTVSKLWKSSIDSSNFIFSYGIRKSLSISFVVNYYQGFQSYMGNVNHNFNSTPLNTNLNFSSVFPIATCDGLWCFSYADNFMAIIWNPSIMKSIAVFIPYFTSQVETQRIVLGFGVRPDNLDPTLLKISYPYSGEGQVVVGNFIYWAASDRCGLHDNGVMHISHSRLLCAWVLEVNGHAVTSYRMIVSVPTPYSSRLLGFNMDEESIIEVDDIGYQMDTTLQVYNRTHEQFQNLGVEANSGTDDRGCGYFMWMDDFMNRISSSWPSTRPSYSAGTSRSAMNVGKAECSNYTQPPVALVGSKPDNPLIDHGREPSERLTGADMRNAMQMMGARHELQRSLAKKVVMITHYRQM
ncbi:F-box domain containing protein [Tanacetum coccineum]